MNSSLGPGCTSPLGTGCRQCSPWRWRSSPWDRSGTLTLRHWGKTLPGGRGCTCSRSPQRAWAGRCPLCKQGRERRSRPRREAGRLLSHRGCTRPRRTPLARCCSIRRHTPYRRRRVPLLSLSGTSLLHTCYNWLGWACQCLFGTYQSHISCNWMDLACLCLSGTFLRRMCYNCPG